MSPVSRRQAAAAGGAMLALLAVAGASSAATTRHESSGLPTSCPSASLVRSTLDLDVRTVTTTTTVAEFPYGSVALPVARAPRYIETCVYATNGKFTGNIVPTTISFAELVTKKDFASARKAASVSSSPIAVRGVGDEAWIVNPPKGDPRAGSSLFVLEDTTDIVISAPPKASNAKLEALARKITSRASTWKVKTSG